MKTATEFYITCDLIGCQNNETYFAGQEELMVLRGWAFVPSQNGIDDWVFCPKHSHLAHLFKGVPR
jgi:hypothetical protein